MNQPTTQNNLPHSLELNTWLKLSLSSSNEVQRQIALEELITNGCPQEFDQAIQILAAKDPSNICRSQAQWLLQSERTKNQLKSVIKKLDITPDYVSLQLQKGNAFIVTAISQLLRKSPSAETLNAWRECLNNTKEPRLVEAGLTILGKFGEKEDTRFALSSLANPNNPDTQVICAAFTMLAQQDKDLLKQHIKAGLSSKSAIILLHSIHLLRSIDEPETLKYLSNLVFNKNPLIRQKALRELTLISFDKIENIFWQYLGREDQAFLLVKAGFLIAFNPDPGFPFKIYDILQISTGIKKHILQLMLKQIIEATQAAGILNKDINTFIAEIQQHINNRRQDQIIQVALGNLKSVYESIRLSAVEQLSQYANNPKIKAVLENQLNTEQSISIKTFLTNFFEDFQSNQIEETNARNQIVSSVPAQTNQAESPKASVVEKPSNQKSSPNTEKAELNVVNFPNSAQFLKLSPKEQKKWLNTIDKIEKYPYCKKTLLDVMDCEDLKKSITLEILKLISKFGNADDATKVYHMTKSLDYSIVAQAIKTVGTIDIDKIILDLNKFLGHEDPRIKSAAFEVYVVADKPAAIQYVGAMLKQTAIGIRQIALSLLPQLDYPSIEPLLWWLLTHENNVELQNQAGYMVAANPTKEGISRLYEFTHSKTGEIISGFEDMWQVALTTGESVFSMTQAEIEESCWDALVTESNEETKDKSDYKFQSVVGEDEDIEAELDSRIIDHEENLKEKIFLHLYKHKEKYIGAAFLLGFLIFNNWEEDPNVIHRANKDVVASEANYIPTENPDVIDSSKGEQVLRSGARNILSSPNYAALMKSAAKESEDFRIEAERNRIKYYEELANDPSADQEDRDWAQAMCNEDYREGTKAYEHGDIAAAEKHFEAALNDSRFNSYGRIQSIQKLTEICDIKRDRSGWFKWMGALFKELSKTDDFKGAVGMENLGETMAKMDDISNQLKSNPQAVEAMRKAFKEKYKMSDSEIEENINNLLNFKVPFDEQPH